MKSIFFTAALAAAAVALPAGAHTVLLNEDFQESTWMNQFTRFDLDHNAPIPMVNAIFMNPDTGIAEPWWTARDASTSINRYAVSHSIYNPAGQSNDWLVSKPINIATKGFILTFEAQSLAIRGGEHGLSDLNLYISETPITKDWQPDEPTQVFKEVPTGDDIEMCDGEFTKYTVPLDDYAGKTVYIAFANKNNDKDILALDNVLVQRLDIAELTASAPAIAVQGDFDVDVQIEATDGKPVNNWKLTFTAGETTLTEEGEVLAAGEKKDFTFTGEVKGDQNLPWSVTLTCDGAEPLEKSGYTHGLLFRPDHKVLLEETTGTKCGNCPIGIYTIESIEQDPELGEKVIPVSIHTNTSGQDPMSSFVDQYAYYFGVQGAPAFRMERGTRVLYVGDNDYTFDPTNEKSLGYTVAQRVKELTFADLDITAKYIEVDGDTKIDATVTLTPAMTIDGSRYKIGLTIVENNVTLNNRLWWQTNYTSGHQAQMKSNLGGWALLPEDVPGVYYQDVARANYGYNGIIDSTPDAPMPPGQAHVYKVVLGLPNTYAARTGTNGQLEVTSPALDKENVVVVAYLIDTKEGTGVVNAAKTAMSENPPRKLNALDFCEALGIDVSVDGIEMDTDAPAEYFTISGQRVADPTPGIYIVRRGSHVTKQVIR